MLISTQWINEFVDLPLLPPKELASRFTLTTAEVEDVKIKGQGLENVTIVEVLSKKPHPEADKLNLVTFSIGGSEVREVVCGAPNVVVGMKVPYAPIGTTLPNGMTLEPKKIRGILSDGMLCSEVELGLGEGKSGLMELPVDAPVGKKLTQFLSVSSDVILEVDNKSLTHRPDLWGHYGMAREFAVAHRKELKNPFNADWQKNLEKLFSDSSHGITFKVEQESSCYAYHGITLEQVAVTEQSPAFIKERLEAVGMRSINSLVDISNYVMLELGIPNHIFDADKIQGGKLHISRLTTATKFKTLDEVERDLMPGDTVISDMNGPLVLAGIMGGESCGVTTATKRIFIEVANWEAPLLRKTSVRLGLRTDSSQRYEKTLDSHQCYKTLLRLIEMVIKLNPMAKVIGRPLSYVKTESLAKEVVLNVSLAKLKSTLGIAIETSEIVDIYTRLGFTVVTHNDSLKVTVPTYRTTKDISCEADLVEEIGRVVGYDNIPSSAPELPVKPVRLSTSKTLHRKIQDYMSLHGRSLEVMTYPLVGAELLTQAQWPEMNEHLKLLNSLSEEADRMRPSLIPSALKIAAENQKAFPKFSFFELGRSYNGFEQERSMLLIGSYSKTESCFVNVLNTIENLMSHLSLNFEFAQAHDKFTNPVFPKNWKGLHPHEFLNIKVMGKFIGGACTIHPSLFKNFKGKGFLTLAVIDLTDIENKELKDKTKYLPVSKFPSSTFDISIVVPENVMAGDLLKHIDSLKLKEVKSRLVADVYMLPNHQKSVTLRTVFENREATLSAEFLKTAENLIVAAFEKAGHLLKA